jgi:NAD(P)-dependent dehydrogenase (short-subunit alcohol dehydrogenase family)
MSGPHFQELADRTAVVTGAARGIGLCIAEALQAVGMHLVLVDRDGPELELAATSLSQRGPVSAVATTLSSEECRTPIEAALARTTPLAVWVNNAGRVSHADAVDTDLAEFEEVFRDNAVSALRGSQIAFRAMTAVPDGVEPGGAVINVTSFVTERALPLRLSYATSKAALENITRYTAAEWAPHGVRVNAVSPGYIDTRLTDWPEDDPRAAAKRATLAGLPARRAGSAEEIARAVLFLASSLSTYTVGQTVFVDGGWHLI